MRSYAKLDWVSKTSHRFMHGTTYFVLVLKRALLSRLNELPIIQETSSDRFSFGDSGSYGSPPLSPQPGLQQSTLRLDQRPVLLLRFRCEFIPGLPDSLIDSSEWSRITWTHRSVVKLRLGG